MNYLINHKFNIVGADKNGYKYVHTYTFENGETIISKYYVLDSNLWGREEITYTYEQIESAIVLETLIDL